MFDLLEWWRTRRKSPPPGALMERITQLDASDAAHKKELTLRQYALSQLDKDGRKQTNGPCK